MVHHISHATSELRDLEEKDRKYKVKVLAGYEEMMKKLKDPVFDRGIKALGLENRYLSDNLGDESCGIKQTEIEDLWSCVEQFDPEKMDLAKEDAIYVEYYKVQYEYLLSELKWFNEEYARIYDLLREARMLRKMSTHGKFDRRADHYHGLARTSVAQRPMNLHGYSNIAPRRVSRKSGLRRIEHSVRKMI